MTGQPISVPPLIISATSALIGIGWVINNDLSVFIIKVILLMHVCHDERISNYLPRR